MLLKLKLIWSLWQENCWLTKKKFLNLNLDTQFKIYLETLIFLNSSFMLHLWTFTDHYSRSDGVLNLLGFAFQWILNTVVHLLYMGTCTAREKQGASVPVSSCLHRILVIFITEKYTNSAKTIRELDDHCQACAHSYLRYSEHAVIWRRRRAHKRVRGVVFWGERRAETPQDGPHSGTPPLNRSRSYITDRFSATKHIKSVHKSDFSLTNYNGKNRTFRQSRAGQPGSSAGQGNEAIWAKINWKVPRV